MIRLLSAPLIGGLLLTAGAAMGGAFSLSSGAWDVAALSLVFVLLSAAFHICRVTRNALLHVALNHSHQALSARFSMTALVLGVPAFFLSEAILADSRRLGGPAVTGALTCALAVFGSLVLCVAESELTSRSRRALALISAASALGLALANRVFLAAQYPAAHLTLAFIALGAAAFCPWPHRVGDRLRLLGIAVFVAAVLACAFMDAPFVARSPGERVFAVARRWLAPDPTDDTADPTLFSRRLGPQRTPDLAAALKAIGGAHSPKRILWITVDALRADRCGFGGYGENTTPHLDRLAEQSTVFDRCYSQGSDSLGSILSSFTGRYPAALNFRRIAEGLAPVGQLNIAEILRDRGFTTVGIPAYEAELLKGTFLPFSRGFQQWTLPAPGGQRAASECLRLASEALKSTRGTNAFIWLHFMEVHGPYPDQSGPFGNDPSGQYDDALRLVDEGLGRLISQARADGDLEDTAILLHGDHGEEFGEHGGRYHGATLYEESIHVPLLIHLPGQTTGQHVPTVTGLINVTPTLLDCLDIPAPSPLQGESLIGPMASQSELSGFALAQLATPFGGRWSAVIDGDRKAIRNDQTHETAFFDLSSDPSERDASTDDFSSRETQQLEQQLQGAYAFARQVPDSTPYVEVVPPPTAKQLPGIDPLSNLPPRDLDFRKKNPVLFHADPATRRAAFDALPPLVRGSSAREMLLAGSKDVRTWILANLLDAKLGPDWVTPFLLMLAEVDDPLLIPLFNRHRGLDPNLRTVDSLVFDSLARAPLRPGGPQFLTKIFRTQGVGARAEAVRLMQQMGTPQALLDRWWDGGRTVSRTERPWNRFELNSQTYEAQCADGTARLLLIRLNAPEDAPCPIGDPLSLPAIFEAADGAAVLTTTAFGVLDDSHQALFAIRLPKVPWAELRIGPVLIRK